MAKEICINITKSIKNGEKLKLLNEMKTFLQDCEYFKDLITYNTNMHNGYNFALCIFSLHSHLPFAQSNFAK